MSLLLRFRSQFLTVALLSCMFSGALHAQSYQWVSMNGILSGGVNQIIPTAKRIYYYGGLSIISHSESEGWRLFWPNLDAREILVAPDGRILGIGNSGNGIQISGDTPQSKSIALKSGYDRNFAIDSLGGIFAIGSNGIGYSRDWVSGWTYKDTTFASLPDLHTTKFGELMAIGGSGIFVSLDSGHTWRHSLDTTIDLKFTHPLNVSNPSAWFVTFGWPYNTHISSDRGKTWALDTLVPFGLSGIHWRNIAEGYASTSTRSYITKDTGKTWQAFSGVMQGIAIGLTSDTIYMYSGGTLYFKSYTDINWRSFGSLVVSTGGTVTSIFEDPVNGTLLASMNNGGVGQGSATLYRSNDSGFWWSEIMIVNLPYLPVGNPALTGTSHGIFYYGYGGVPLRSTDYGLTWHRTTGWIGDTAILSMTQLPSGELYAVNGAAIYRSSDGNIWGLTDELNNFVTIGSDPSGRLYAGTTQTSFLNPGTVYRSTNGGSPWQKLSVELTLPHNIRTDGRNVYVSDDYGLYHSTDFGDTWAFSDSGRTKQVLDAIPVGYDSYAMLSDSHLTIFPHGADSIAEQPPNVGCMFSDPQTHFLYTGGYNGVDKSTTPIFYAPLRVAQPASSSVNNDEVVADGRSIEVRYDLAEPQDVRLTLMDVLGRSISQTRLGVQSQGVHEYVLGTQTVAQGAYFLVISKGGISSTHHVAILE